MNFTEINMRVRAIDMVMENDHIWTTAANSNYIYELNTEDRTVNILGELEGDILAYPYGAIVKFENQLFFVPKAANKIVVYDLHSQKTKYIEIEKPVCERKEVYRETIKFHHAYSIGETIFLLGYFYPAIICINARTLEIKYVDDWLIEIEKQIESGDDRGYFGGGYFERDGMVFFPSACSNNLVMLNLSTLKSEVINLECGLDGITYMVKDGESLWLTGKAETYGMICRYDLNTRSSIAIENIEDRRHIKGHYHPFWKLINYAEYIWLFPYTATCSYRINKSTMQIEKLDYVEKLKICYDEFTEVTNCYMVKQFGSLVYMVTYEGWWIEINLDTAGVEKYEYKASLKEVQKELTRKLDGGVCNEAQIGLENFIDIIRRD